MGDVILDLCPSIPHPNPLFSPYFISHFLADGIINEMARQIIKKAFHQQIVSWKVLFSILALSSKNPGVANLQTLFENISIEKEPSWQREPCL